MSCSNCPPGCARCPESNQKKPVYDVDKSNICICPTPIDQSSIRRYTPVCCPVHTKRDPRRGTVYCPPVVSRSEPLSHAEYLRRLKSGVVSTPSALVQVGQGAYKKTLWMESGGTCCVTPAPVPAVHPIGHRLDNTGRAEVAGAVAGRGTLSHYDQGTRDASLTTLRAAGKALAATGICVPCAPAEGTSSSVVPGDKCC
jgi:hypothetical protein